MKTIRFESEAFKAIMTKLDQIYAYVQQNMLVKNNQVETKEKSGWIDSLEVSRILNLSKRTLQRWRSSGKLKYSKIGNSIFYKREDVEQLLKANRKTYSSGITIKGFFCNIFRSILKLK